MRPGRRTVAAHVCAVSLAVLPLSACAQDRPAAAPAGIGASLLQYRSDQTSRRVQLKVANDGAAPVTVTSARLVAGEFAGDASWAAGEGPVTVAPGQRVDLPAALPAPRCPAVPGEPRIRVEVATDGGPAVVTVPARDPHGVLARVHREDCLRAAVTGVVRAELVGPVRRERSGDRLIGHVGLRLTPTGAPGEVRLGPIGPTTLLQPPEGDVWDVDVAIGAAAGPRTVDVPVVPARCDPHAVAEDKLGTVLPVSVRIGGTTTGTIAVAASRDLRQQLYEYVVAACR